VVTAEQHAFLSEFHKIDGRVLRAVWYVWMHGCLDKIIFEFDEVSLLVEAETDYDTIAVRCIGNDKLSDYSTLAGSTDLWNPFIGKPFMWGWITINQQNYLDGILLSFDTIVPNILLNVAASSIEVRPIRKALDA
jgi:hypothetical protein